MKKKIVTIVRLVSNDAWYNDRSFLEGKKMEMKNKKFYLINPKSIDNMLKHGDYDPDGGFVFLYGLKYKTSSGTVKLYDHMDDKEKSK